MVTLKRRINITTEPEVEFVLKRIARRDRVPMATKAAELIAVALELEEDIVLASLAAKRAASKTRLIPHGSVWK